jgi:hypothetical protein
MSTTSNSVFVSSGTPSVDKQVLHLSPPSNPLTDSHPTENSANNSTFAQNPAPQVRPPPLSGNSPSPPNALSFQQPKFVRPPSPTSVVPSLLLPPHNKESAALTVPSETFTGPFSFSSANASLHVPQSTPSIISPAEILPPLPNWDRNIAANQEIRQFVGSKTNSPLLPKNKDERMVGNF